MKFCNKHEDQLTGEGDCFQCKIDSLHNLIFQQQTDLNLGNAVIASQRKEIAELKERLQLLG